MAKTKAKNKQEFGSVPLVRVLLWLALAGAWVMVVLALISYDPADWPGHAVAPHNQQPSNWIGVIGAMTAHQLYLMLGPGVWILVAGALAGLAATAALKPISQLVLRTVGLVLMAIAVSCLVSLWAPHMGLGVQGPGGLLAVYLVDQLVLRFSTVGSAVVLIVGFWVGAILAADQVLAAGYRLLCRCVAAVAHIDLPRPSLEGRFRLAPLGGLLAGRGESRSGSAAATAGRSRGAARRSPAEEAAEAEEDEGIDPDAGGLGATTSFGMDEARHELAPEPEPADDEPEELEAQVDDGEDDEEDVAENAPAAYLAEKASSGKFDPEALRAKISKLPVNVAPRPQGASGPIHREVDLSGYKFPEMEVLEEAEDDFTDEQEDLVREQAENLESAMREYGIGGSVVKADSGPTITMYEVDLAAGTRVQRLNSVASDLARALRAQNIRIVPNMAGKQTVGIEVPNLKREKVRLKELMSADPEVPKKMHLPMWLGKDASGEPLIGDLSTMPHMLIAGTTGSGKSVCMNTIIMSFLFTKRPDELKLVLVDPKMVEMSMYKDVPHLMCPVVTEMAKAAAILEWAVTKMDERYELLAEAGVRDIASYNSLGWEELKERFEPASEVEEAKIPKKLPYIVFVIDELADLMMTNKEVEHHIVRIAQKARAVGMHLILATQRPQANVVTGLIKGNMPCRVSFKVASKLDSRIVLDQGGAELLLGHGDMLYLNPKTSKITRCQGTLVDDIEIRRTCKFLKTVAAPSFEPQLVQIKSPGDVGEVADKDELFDDAVRIVLETKRGSVSLLQRRLAIGYARSSRLIEQMSEAGILGEYKGSQAREVTMTLDEWDAMQAQLQADADQGLFGSAEAGEEDDGDDGGVPSEMADEYRN